MTHTPLVYTDAVDLEYPVAARWWAEFRLTIGRWLSYYAEPAAELAELAARDAVRQARSPGSCLSEDDAQAQAAFMTEVQDLAIRRRHFATTPLERTFQGLGAALVETVLEADPTLRRVANIGAHYAYIDHWLAGRWPRVAFTALDFPSNFAEFNAEFIRPNIEFVPGYALELLESGRISPDLALFSSTANEIRSEELVRYFRWMSGNVRYVVLNEPIYPLPTGEVVNPDEVDAARPIPVRCHPRVSPGHFRPLAYVHNYRALLEEAGLRVMHYHAFRPEFSDVRMIQVVAQGRTRS